MPETALPKPLTDLPTPEKDLPLPEKELKTNDKLDSNLQGEALKQKKDPPGNESKSLHVLKYFFSGILFVIIVLVFGAGIIMYKVNKDDSPSSQISERTISQAPSPTIEPISKWKTHEDQTLSFKYPSNYFLEVKDGIIHVNKEKNNRLSSIFTISYDEKYFIDLASIKKCSEELKVNEYGMDEEACIGKNGGNEPIKTITIDGKQANDFYITNPGLGGGPRIIQLKNPTVIIWPSTSDKTLNEILSTVKFINLNTSNWKTYSGNGTSFKYPIDAKISNEKAYSFMTGQNPIITKVIGYTPDETYTLKIFIENNQNNLNTKQLIDEYLKRNSEPSGDTPSEISGNKMISDSVSSKINNSLEDYKNGEISGIHALFGFDYDYDVIVMSKNNKIYTFLYHSSDGGKISDDAEKIVRQILSTFNFN